MTERNANVTRRPPLTPFRQMELAEILRIANSKVAALPWVAAFELAPARDHADRNLFHNRAQIRAVPRTGSGEIEFRYDLPLSASGCASFEDRAWDLLDCAHRFHTDTHLADLGRRTRSRLEPLVAPTAGNAMPTGLTIGVAFGFTLDEPNPCAELGMRGNDLEVGVERFMAEDAGQLARQVERAVESHRRRERAAFRAGAEGLSGWVDQAALRIIDAAGLDRRETFGWVRADGDVGVSFADGEGRRFGADLFEDDGVIRGWVRPSDRRWSLRYDELTIWGEGIPDAIVGSLIGRRVGSVFGSALLPEDARITTIQDVESVDDEDDEEDQTPGWLRLNLDIPRLGIGARTGDVVQTPKDGRR